MDNGVMTVRRLRGMTDEDDGEYDDADDEFDVGVPLGQYMSGELQKMSGHQDILTAERSCGTIAPAISTGAPALTQPRQGDVKMSTSGEMTEAQRKAAEKAAEKKAALLAKQDDAAVKKAEMEKSKAEQAARDAKIKAEKAAAAAKEKAAKAAADAKAKEAKAKEVARLKAEADKAKAKAAAEKAAEKAKADKEKAAAKAKAEAEKLKAKAIREAERAAARAAREAAGTLGKTVPADLSRYSVNKEVKTAGGHASVDIGDALATRLRGMALDAVYKEAAKTLKVSETDLRAKYLHLNPGMQRMNLGNRMRAELSKGH